VILSGLARPRGRILLVDDDADAALFATYVLGTVGHFTVTHTADPVTALQLITSDTWNLVLTETDLPGLSGRGLVQAVRRLAPGLPVVVLTAHLLVDAEADALRELADAYLVKPVPADRLIAAVTGAATWTT
jgi:DNA-binding NtrC family response regulator